MHNPILSVFLRPCPQTPAVLLAAVVGMLEDIKVPQGRYLLQNAANSILGKELISAAHRKGVKTINVVRRKEVVQELQQLGCAPAPGAASSHACQPTPYNPACGP